MPKPKDVAALPKLSSDATKQAGGGVAPWRHPQPGLQVKTLEAAVLNPLRVIYNQLESQYKLTTRQGLVEWLRDVQKEDVRSFDIADGEGFNSFLEFMTSEWGSAQDWTRISNGDPSYYDHPMSNYFISSSHNTYLTGHQLYGESTVEGYRNVLLRGGRCVEIDVWDGQPPSSSSSSDEEAPPPPQKGSNQLKKTLSQGEPVVLHGYTATREISFRQVCEAIRDNAFVTSDLPVILSLEVHTSHEQQEIMVEIMNTCFKGILLGPDSLPHNPDECTELPSPNQLRNKILIKVKYSPPKSATEESKNGASIPDTSENNSDDETSKVRSNQPKSKPSKIVEALSRLGVYTRSCHFKSLTQPEATIPTHVFSLSEKAFMEVHKTDPIGLFNHNKHYFMRTYPKGTRVSSSNLDPAPFWRQGVQMVALNWQKLDGSMMLNDAMFSNSDGWVLKPERFRSASMPLPVASLTGQQTGSLSIEFIAGQDLPVPKGIKPEDLRPYVKCELHVETLPDARRHVKSEEFKAKTKAVKGIHPSFASQIITFDGVPALDRELSFLR
ncbi:PLC-like phosphodiesterase [Trichodelitschia bisporula]|uniref:Phosphoinositide phospholipase C n=1 Tax=Trichodelitschia bisporula TaxID=703511 RepID=A0A6G1HNY0_9PEZI|nr:PLC-like phosphodiesterase [Trichodelitschia bisporula]